MVSLKYGLRVDSASWVRPRMSARTREGIHLAREHDDVVAPRLVEPQAAAHARAFLPRALVDLDRRDAAIEQLSGDGID